MKTTRIELERHKAFRDRRVLDGAEIHAVATFRLPVLIGLTLHDSRQELRKWIEISTRGRFFLGGGYLSFELESDVMMYKLSEHYDFNRNEISS